MRAKCTDTPSGASLNISRSIVGVPGGMRKPSRARHPSIPDSPVLIGSSIEPRYFAERDWLHGIADPVVADFGRGNAARFGDQLDHGQAAQPALARPHAAARERLHLVGAGTALLRDELANFAGGDFLAA